MAELIHPTHRQCDGLWLIDAENLRQLDDLLARFRSRAEEIRDKCIQSEVSAAEEQLRDSVGAIDSEAAERQEMFIRSMYRSDQDKKLVTVRLSHDRRIQASSFDEIIKDRSMALEIPLGFSAQVRVGDASLKICLGSYSRDRLTYEIDTKDSALASESVHEINSWIAYVEARIWQRWWKAVAEWRMLFVILLVALTVYSLPFFAIQKSSDLYMADLRQEAAHILSDGISENNILEVADLILRFTSKHVPADYESTPPRRWIKEWISVMGMPISSVGILLLFLILVPNSHLGIGQGQSRIKFWRVYMKFIFYWVPVLVILPVVLQLALR